MGRDSRAQIRAAVKKRNTALFDFQNVVDFLRDTSSDKDNIQRLFAYLVFFDLATASDLPSAVARIHARYVSRLADPIFDGDPLRAVPPRDAQTIGVDLPRIVLWFGLCASSSGCEVPPQDEVLSHARRIFALLYLDGPTRYRYTQGHDRFVFLIFLVCLHFTGDAELDPIVAESLTFSLVCEIIALHATDRILGLSANLPMFNRIDGLVRKRAPLQAAALQAQGFWSIHYALRWQMVFFADEHDWKDTLAIWDAIFARRDAKDEFICQLAVEHVRQVPMREGVAAVEAIQTFKDWDQKALLEEAIGNYTQLREQRSMVAVIIALLLLLILY
jgi:hypothetical protein